MSCAEKDTTRSQTASQFGSVINTALPAELEGFWKPLSRKSLLKRLETGVMNQGIEIREVS